MFVLIAAISMYAIFNQSVKKELISPLSTRYVNSSLKNVVDNALAGTRGTYGIVIKNLKTGESYYSNERKIFEAGSLYKLWLMGAVYEKINKGEIAEDEILSQDVAVLNQEFGIGQDEAELTEDRVTLSVTDALRQMIVISHNYAALLLAEKVGVSGIKSFLSENGFNSSETGTPPKTTASDIALFFEKLHQGKLVSPEYSQKMIELLKEQQSNDGLPKYLPDKSKVANKTGDIGWFKHDAGIIYTDTGDDYVIVVMSESDSPAGAQERIALISKAVYDYFNNR